MTSAETYRATAAAMRKRAAMAGTPEHRAAWMKMATKWEALARDVEAAVPASGPAGQPDADPKGAAKADEVLKAEDPS